MVCRFEHFNEAWYARWCAILKLDDVSLPFPQRNLHRKAWEFCAIAQALDERNVLTEGKHGVGFAVGREPLVSLFASKGATVLATDVGDEAISKLWQSDNQHSAQREDLFVPHLIEKDPFDARVTYQPADMRELAGFEPRSYDFVWSACALEHLGSLAAGLTFIRQSAGLLKKGGVAVHTSEYNVSSDDATLETPTQVIYRRQDMKALAAELSGLGYAVEDFDFDSGNHKYDLEYDRLPWYADGRKHIKLQLGNFIATSIMIVIRA